MISFLVCCIAVVAAATASSSSSCHFANDYLTNVTSASSFVDSLFKFDARFLDVAVGANGVTFDGFYLNQSGIYEGASYRHNFSASSKESLHLAMLALFFDGNPHATVFFQNSVSSSNVVKIVSLIERKLTAFEDFDRRFPAFGGYLPWFAHDGSGAIVPAHDWQNTVPSLDNGEMIYGIVALREALAKSQYAQLARVKQIIQRLDDRLALMARTAEAVFYDGQGRVRCVTEILNVSDRSYDPSNYKTVPPCYLDDPYEGELFVHFLCMQISQAECDKIWQYKAPQLKSATYNNITTQLGFWFSSHENWKLLMMPYTLSATARSVFEHGELARLQYSVDNNYPGLFASTNMPDGTYMSALGVPPLASQFTTNLAVTPYGAYVALLLFPNAEAPLRWLAATLSAGRMQSRYGAIESIGVAGPMKGEVAKMTTFDTKLTTLVGVCGGIGHLTSIWLTRLGHLNSFVNRTESTYGAVFANFQRRVDPRSLPWPTSVTVSVGSDFEC